MATANIADEVRETGRFASEPFEVDLNWSGNDGREHSAKNVGVSHAALDSFFYDGVFFSKTLEIAYVPSKPELSPIPLSDIDAKKTRAQRGMWLGCAGLALALLSFVLGLLAPKMKF